jgi:hypothetical protein
VQSLAPIFATPKSSKKEEREVRAEVIETGIGG